MGYSHSWRPKGALDRETWLDALDFVHGVIAVAVADGIALAGGDGHGKPVLTQDEILFNGRADQGYETFHILRVPELKRWADEDPDYKHFGFCKTGRRPYDVVVTAVLCILETVTGGHFRVSSDGSPEDWAPGLALARRVVSSAEIPAGVLERES